MPGKQAHSLMQLRPNVCGPKRTVQCRIRGNSPSRHIFASQALAGEEISGEGECNVWAAPSDGHYLRTCTRI